MARGERNVALSGPSTSLAKSARTRVNPTERAGTGKKNPTSEPVGFWGWWSWGDLNLRRTQEQSGLQPIRVKSV